MHPRSHGLYCTVAREPKSTALRMVASMWYLPPVCDNLTIDPPPRPKRAKRSPIKVNAVSGSWSGQVVGSFDDRLSNAVSFDSRESLHAMTPQRGKEGRPSPASGLGSQYPTAGRSSPAGGGRRKDVLIEEAPQGAEDPWLEHAPVSTPRSRHETRQSAPVVGSSGWGGHAPLLHARETVNPGFASPGELLPVESQANRLKTKVKKQRVSSPVIEWGGDPGLGKGIRG